MINDVELYHHGILGQKWGVRRYQNPDGTLTKAGQCHVKQLEKKDIKWAEKNEEKITSKAYKKSSKELAKYDKKLLTQAATGKKYINAHNQKMAELMNTKVSDISSPSGRVVKFVAKRGELGVYMALADQGYDMNKVKNGVWTDGRIAYKKSSVDMAK
jgi:vacuolar-type H+-ATPase subunit H